MLYFIIYRHPNARRARYTNRSYQSAGRVHYWLSRWHLSGEMSGESVAYYIIIIIVFIVIYLPRGPLRVCAVYFTVYIKRTYTWRLRLRLRPRPSVTTII